MPRSKRKKERKNWHNQFTDRGTSRTYKINIQMEWRNKKGVPYTQPAQHIMFTPRKKMLFDCKGKPKLPQL